MNVGSDEAGGPDQVRILISWPVNRDQPSRQERAKLPSNNAVRGRAGRNHLPTNCCKGVGIACAENE